MATWNDVRRLALALPQTTQEASYGSRVWKFKKKGFVWERPLRRSDLEALSDKAPSGPILGVRTPDLEMKDLLLRSDRNVFFTTPHFDGYPAVLVRLEKIGVKKLEQIIVEAWLARAPNRTAKEFLEKRK